MKTIIAGSRNIVNKLTIFDAIKHCGWDITEIVSGCARGPDQLGEEWAHSNDIPVIQFPANWRKYGKSGGPIRNRKMAKYAKALIAVWDGESKGTFNMIKVARELGLKVFIWRKQAYLNLNSWAGRTTSRVNVLKETPSRYKIELLEDCLKGKVGKVFFVPKYAVSFRFEEYK